MQKGMALLGTVFLVGLYFFLLINPAHAAVPERYNNENFWTSEHDRPVSLYIDPVGNFFGFTLTGKFYSQVNVKNDLGIRMQKFSIDDAFYFVTDKGVIIAPSAELALRSYLKKAL